MDTFSTKLQNALDNRERAQEFINSPFTQRLKKLKKFYWCEHKDILLLYATAVTGVAGGGVIAALEMGASAIHLTMIGLLYAGIMGYGAFASIGVRSIWNKWKNKASVLGLGEFYPSFYFEAVDETLSETHLVKIIETCEKAGASPHQITQLYELTLASVPRAWWEEVENHAVEFLCAQIRQKMHFEHCQLQEEEKRLAQAKIHDRLNCIATAHQCEDQANASEIFVAKEKIGVHLDVVNVEGPIERTQQTVAVATQIKL